MLEDMFSLSAAHLNVNSVPFKAARGARDLTVFLSFLTKRLSQTESDFSVLICSVFNPFMPSGIF